MIWSRTIWLALGLFKASSAHLENGKREFLPKDDELVKALYDRTPHSTTSASSCSASTETATKWKTTTCYITTTKSASVSTKYIHIYKTVHVTVSSTITNTNTVTDTSTLVTILSWSADDPLYRDVQFVIYSMSRTTITDHETVTTTSTDIQTEVSTSTSTATLTESFTTTTTVPTTLTESLTETQTTTSTLTIPITSTEKSTETSTQTSTSTLTVITTTTELSISNRTLTEPTTTTTTSLTTVTEISVSLATDIVSVPTTIVSTIVIPASTFTSTITNVITGPPGSTIVRITTITIEAKTQTITRLGSVITVTNAAVCPAPTNSGPFAPQDSGPSALWGCSPGYVCNVPKPTGCILFADPPQDDYLCEARYCIPAPPLCSVVWPNNEPSYYPPTSGYFNLNPNAFGLDYGIFFKKVIVTYTTKYGRKVPSTYTTGKWESQASLTHFPPSPTQKLRVRLFNKIQKRDITIVPAVCYNQCDNCYKEAQRVGKSSALCGNGSAFQLSYESCQVCVVESGDTLKVSLQAYVEPRFAPFLRFCNAQPAQSEIEAPSTSTLTFVPLPVTESQNVVTETASTPIETVAITTQPSSTPPVPITPITISSPPPPTPSPPPSSSPSESTSSSSSSSPPSPIVSSPPPPIPSSTSSVASNGTATISVPPIQVTNASNSLRSSAGVLLAMIVGTFLLAVLA